MHNLREYNFKVVFHTKVYNEFFDSIITEGFEDTKGVIRIRF